LVIRARFQAMQARGDAYFENWQQRMAEVSDPDFRARAEQHRAQLQERFGTIKQRSSQAREAFGSFLADLRKLRSTLEAHPQIVEAETTKQLVQETSRNGLAVEQGLDAMEEELRVMTALVLPAGAPAAQSKTN